MLPGGYAVPPFTALLLAGCKYPLSGGVFRPRSVTVGASTESIDADGLEALASSAKADPSTGRKTLKAVTTCEGGFRNLTQMRGTRA